MLLTAGLAMIDLLDGRLAIGEIGRVAAGILVFAIAAIAGWTLTGRMR